MEFFPKHHIKFIYSKKATKFSDISTLLLSYVSLCARMEILAWFLLEGKSYSHTEGPHLTRFLGLGKNRVRDFWVSGGPPVRRHS